MSTEQKVYLQYVDNTLTRLYWIVMGVLGCELVIVVMDIVTRLYARPVYLLNLAVHIMMIIMSLGTLLFCRQLKKSKDVPAGKKKAVILAYRGAIVLALLVLIFTDIYMKQRALGYYLAYFFVLQVTPAYKARINWIHFMLIGLYAIVLYACLVKSTNIGAFFSTMLVFVCFAISSDFLRYYFKHSLEQQFNAEDNYDRYRKLSEQTIVALAGAVEAKDAYTKGHCTRVAKYAKEISRRMGYSLQQQQDVYQIGLMHDIGKIGVPDEVINKTGKLTDEEFMKIKQHPAMGYDILKQITELPGISEGARWHHERYNGKGYPDGLAGEDIPEIARIIAVADAYDAMTSNRSYREIMPQEKVRAQIADNAGTQFDPRMAEIMLGMIDEDKEYTMHE